MSSLRTTVRECIALLDKATLRDPFGEVPNVIAKLEAAGAVRNMHLNRPNIEADCKRDPQLMLEWYAGQILDVLQSEAWFAVNSLINCRDKFAPEMP